MEKNRQLLLANIGSCYGIDTMRCFTVKWSAGALRKWV
jgi:hypothetical protein